MALRAGDNAGAAPEGGDFKLGTTERRLALVIVMTAVVPLAVCLWLVRSFAANAAQLWLNPEVGYQLDAAVRTHDALVAAVKADFRHQGVALAHDAALLELVRARDGAGLQVMCRKDLDTMPDLVRLRLVGAGGEETMACARAGGDTEATMRRLLVVQPVPTLENVQLESTFAAPASLVVERDRAAVFSDQYARMVGAKDELYAGHAKAFVVLLALTVLTTAGLAVLLARGVTRRVRRLARALARLGKGDMAARVPVTGNDELTALAASFNQMASELGESRARIEYLGRVAEWQEMAKRLAHEIKNPLTPILLSVEEAERRYDGDDEEHRALLATTRQMVTEEVDALRRLVTTFSSFARLPEVVPEPTSVDGFIDDCAATLGFRDADGVRWVPARTGAVCNMDRQLLRRALANLVENAVQLTSSEDRQVIIEATLAPPEAAREGAGGTLEVVVDDNGPGVPPELGARVFEPYVTRRPNGTGLGLAIAKKIVVEHGGTLTALRSPRLRGARFRISLPIDRAVNGVAHAADRAVMSSTG